MADEVTSGGGLDPDRLCARTATELVGLLRSGEVSAVEVLTDHLERIDEANGAVNAVVNIDAEGALREARRADAARAGGAPLGALHGLPISVKDTASTVGFPTTFGSPRFADDVAAADDLHVARIRAAGAVRIGKTNVPEHAAGSNTVNTLFGATRNPYDLSRSVGGSSGGAAAGLAAGFHPIADGSDMGGSLRNPAAFCNVVGFRPTPGVVPNTSDDVSSTLSVTGPLARTVDDLALLLSVMAGPDPRDPLSYAAPRIGAAVRPVRVAGLRVALAPTLGGRTRVDREIVESVERAARLLEEAGAEIVEAAPDLDGSVEVFRTLRAAEFFDAFGADLDAGAEPFVDFLAANIEEGRRLTATDVLRAQRGQTRLIRAAAHFFEDVDVLLSATTSTLPFVVEDRYPRVVAGEPMDDYLSWMEACFALTPLGVPGISVPNGFSASGLPIGLQLTAGPRRDARLLSIARSVVDVLPRSIRPLVV
jgi:amidase